MERPIQFDFVDKVKSQTMDWAKTVDIKLHQIETVIPFTTTDKSLSVWIFFETNAIIKKYKKDGTEEKVKQQYLTNLKNLSYPPDYLDQVTFVIDSHENVERNFEGSYFYRLR